MWQHPQPEPGKPVTTRKKKPPHAGRQTVDDANDSQAFSTHSRQNQGQPSGHFRQTRATIKKLMTEGARFEDEGYMEPASHESNEQHRYLRQGSMRSPSHQPGHTSHRSAWPVMNQPLRPPNERPIASPSHRSNIPPHQEVDSDLVEDMENVDIYGDSEDEESQAQSTDSGRSYYDNVFDTRHKNQSPDYPSDPQRPEYGYNHMGELYIPPGRAYPQSYGHMGMTQGGIPSHFTGYVPHPFHPGYPYPVPGYPPYQMPYSPHEAQHAFFYPPPGYYPMLAPGMQGYPPDSSYTHLRPSSPPDQNQFETHQIPSGHQNKHRKHAISAKLRAQKRATLVNDDNGQREYQLHLSTVMTNNNFKAKKYAYGDITRQVYPTKTLMMIGATGSGKSTLIDGMANYLLGVEYKNDVRFRLVSLTDEEKTRVRDQSKSQTEWITCYSLCMDELDEKIAHFNLNIIDTPGFADTAGVARDKRLVQQIKYLFKDAGNNSVDCLDAVCFVVQNGLARLTVQQKYVFDQILSIFGKDIAENIFFLITFADGDEPPVLASIESHEIPYIDYFTFNNSALFSNKSKGTGKDNFAAIYWQMGEESFKTFFEHLGQVSTKSLKLTTEVLKERDHLQACLAGLHPQVKKGLTQLSAIRHEEDILKSHEADIKANKNFSYQVKEIHAKKVSLEPKQYVTNCLYCNRTCHFPCYIPKDEDKHKCWAMSDRRCRICPFKCLWDQHCNNDFRYEDVEKTVTKTSEELKNKYAKANKEAAHRKSAIQSIQQMYNQCKEEVMDLVIQIYDANTRLQQISLKDNPLSVLEYIDLLIESEKQECKPGWNERVTSLTEVRRDAEMLKGIKERGKKFDPFDHHHE